MRVVIYDASSWAKNPQFDLPASWRIGSRAFRALGRFDRILGAGSWAHAASWLRGLGPVDEVQFWGHGSRGTVWIDGEPLRADSLWRLDGVHIVGCLWLRTCASFAGPAGHTLARSLARRFPSARIAGHTHGIHILQSGLHTIRLGESPSWTRSEGIDANGKMMWSSPWAPHTITCVQADIPEGW